MIKFPSNLNFGLCCMFVGLTLTVFFFFRKDFVENTATSLLLICIPFIIVGLFFIFKR